MLNVKNLTFSYSKQFILKQLNFTVQKGEHLAIIGESGCGKSTLLKLLYGEFDLNKGQIFWDDTEILGPEYNLVIGYDFMKSVAQEFDLMPFISVEENIGKYLSNFYPEEKQKRTTELLKVVELEAVAKTKVKLLSGGQKQRVALARALAKQPEILLMDEPFSHIDNFKKQSLRRNIFSYLKENNIACIVATHDKNDVLGFADQMMLLNNKVIEAKDTPETLYKNPKSPLMASFFGEFNVINEDIIYANELVVVDKSSLKVTVQKSYFNGRNYLIKALLDTQDVIFEHEFFIEIGQSVYLSKRLSKAGK
jgi:iron(III) transport system ATP-binding protein|tara:strand:+ start:943 stop:1869 length:927 start_codon:yes stop_codon:yes gene_type:complete